MMITKICHIIADFFIKEKIISEEQRDVYEYGLELCVSTLIGVIITVVITQHQVQHIMAAVLSPVYRRTQTTLSNFIMRPTTAACLVPPLQMLV